MNNIAKKLSVAIYWHMHQPVYELDGVFYMPWARLHAVKDYLDMVTILEKFPKLKLNFDVVPALVDDIIQYTELGYNDIHSTISVAPISELDDSEKEYILNNFFNSKYETMVRNYPRYKDLSYRRYFEEKTKPNDYTEQEYSDIIALFNLSWIDPSHRDRYEGLRELIDKTENYTLEDRQKIIDIHRQIMRDIIPTYKKYINEGRIELTTSPYYHPIMPILCDYATTTKNLPDTENLPVEMNLTEDAHQQVRLAMDRLEEIFGKRPKGFWASEYCLTDGVLKLLAEEGVNWTISDETILSKSIGFEFVRDFKGNLEDPYYLLKTYNYAQDNSDINIIFRDSHLPNLINFEYCNIDSKIASNDLYNKIKSVQNKLLVSPDENHMLTIALDGENCWENYENDGNDFLESIYSKICSDDSLETVLISDYISADRNPKILTKIHPGSWINKNFNFWIGEPVKNLAWQYLNNVRNDIINILNSNPEKKNAVMKEIYMAEGSDWFWWYGEPNNSGQDNIFDFLFREHLKNAYKILGVNPPKYLNASVIESATKQSTPEIYTQNTKNMLYTKSINLIDGPVFHESKLFDNVSYGIDSKYIYFELKMNSSLKELETKNSRLYQFCIYMKNADKEHCGSTVRLSNKTEVVFPILREKYHNELSITLTNDKLYPSYLSESMPDNLWKVVDSNDLDIIYKDKLTVRIPFDDIGIKTGEKLEFFFVIADAGLRSAFMPKDVLISVKRP